MTTQQAIEALHALPRMGQGAPGLARMQNLCDHLGNPEKELQCIHIAGTNGKGSLAAMTSSILTAAGYKTGLTISPYVVDFRERFQIDGEMIPPRTLANLTEKVLDAIDAIEAEGGEKPVEFEAVTALAFLWFAREKCDLVVLETGLGGRCDATNVVPHKLVAAITKIGYDHMAVLGNTLAEIAAEKTGIIKKGTSLVLESQEAEVMTVFEAKVREEGIIDFRLIDPLEIKEQTYRDGRQYFSFGAYRDLSMRMLGVHQYENAIAALLGAEAFFRRHTEWICGGTKEREEGVRRAVCQGIAKTVWKGRMEILSKKPFLLVDGAHNSNGVEALRESLVALFPGEKFHFIMGVMADKDYETMIGELLPLAIDFTTCTVECERALQADALADCIRRKGIAAASADDFASCFQRGRLDETHRTVAFGSLYFIGEIEALFEAK